MRPLVHMLAATSLIAIASSAEQHCFMPDGSLADEGLTPCNTTAEVSACCDPRDSCTTSGLCLGASGWIYRSACTDQDWTSAGCPSQCHTDPILETAYSTFAPIYPCESGLGTSAYCCASYAQTADPSCCFSNFTLGNTGLAFKPGTDAMQAQVSSLSASLAAFTSATSKAVSATVTTTVTASATASATATAAGSGGGVSVGTAVGAGVGVPLGVLALSVIGFLVWREKRRQQGPDARWAATGAVGGNGGFDGQNGYRGGDAHAPAWTQQQGQGIAMSEQPLPHSYTPFPTTGPQVVAGEVPGGAPQPWKDPADVRHELRG